MPFYSVLPDVARYPACQQFGPDPESADDDGERISSMGSARIRDDLEEIVEAAALLVEGRLPFDLAMHDHFARSLALGEGHHGHLWSTDGTHPPFVTDGDRRGPVNKAP